MLQRNARALFTWQLLSAEISNLHPYPWLLHSLEEPGIEYKSQETGMSRGCIADNGIEQCFRVDSIWSLAEEG